MYISFFRVFVIFILIAQVSFAGSLDQKQKALDIIAAFADRMCTKVPLTAKDDSLELTGEGKADLQVMIKKVANLGFKGAIKYKDSEYIGYLQKDLISALENSLNCRLIIWEDLKNHLLGSDEQEQSSLPGKDNGQVKQRTEGNQSPAINTGKGDVTINYGGTK